jgi:hypothetical protein
VGTVSAVSVSAQDASQLELFPTLPVLLRPSRQLRLTGFQLEVVHECIADLIDCRRELDRNAAKLAAAVSAAKTIGQVLPEAYGVAVEIEEVLGKITKKLQEAEEWRRVLERELDEAVEKQLTRGGALDILGVQP